MGLYFVELRWLNSRLLNCNYKRYLKNIRPESKKYTGQIFILKKTIITSMMKVGS